MDIDNQKNYWDAVAQQKTFTHPVDINLLLKYIDKDAGIVDYGCGYGRLEQELLSAGFSNIRGYDTSIELIKRGRENNLPIHTISDPAALPIAENSIDCFLLFAVITCIPSNEGQSNLLKLLRSKLKPGGFLYLSDYYLQDNEVSKSRYTFFNDDPANFGVFTIPEGATLRHHTKEWIAALVTDFILKEEKSIEVKTMNGNSAQAFQLVLQRAL